LCVQRQTDDNVVKRTTMLSNGRQCCQTDDNVVKRTTMLSNSQIRQRRRSAPLRQNQKDPPPSLGPMLLALKLLTLVGPPNWNQSENLVFPGPKPHRPRPCKNWHPHRVQAQLSLGIFSHTPHALRPSCRPGYRGGKCGRVMI
jgi:hypothetical protein